jgi:glycosyltransferase involved in cell wall biosynthesis
MTDPFKHEPSYSVLIRTFNSEATLSQTLASLNAQTNSPAHYVIVDSGSTDATLALVPDGAHVHKYIGREFNFAEALNQGLQFVKTEYVLIISSHTLLGNRQSMEYALGLMHSDPLIAAAYFCHENAGVLRHEIIGQHNFNGFNGLWNTCAVIRTAFLRKRGFRPDVFSSEDQEWAAWLFANEGQVTARISGGALEVHNPRKDEPRKIMNEYVCIAYYANRKLLDWPNIAGMISCGLRLGTGIGAVKRKYHLRLAARLIACHFFKPRGRSRYF